MPRRLVPKGFDRRGAAWLAAMSLMLFVLLLPVNSYVAVLSFVRDEWNLNNTAAGAIFSAYPIGYALSALLFVPLTDRLGPRRVLLGSAVLSVVAHLLFALVAQGIVSGVLLRALAGAGFVGVYVPGSRLVAERFKGRSRGAAIGLFTSAQYAANSGSLALTGTLLATFEWRDAYGLMSLAAIAGLPIAYLLLRSQSPRPVRGSSGRLDLTGLRSPAVRYLILGYSLHALQLHAVRVWLPGFLLVVLLARGADEQRAVVTAATVAALLLAVGALGPVMGGMLSDRLGRATAAAIIFTVSGACSWIIGWSGEFPWALIILIGVVYGWASAADSAIYLVGITEVTYPARLGSTLALQAFLGLAVGAVGPILFGGVLDLASETYRWGLAFSAFGLLAVVAVGGLLRLRSLPASRSVARGRW